MSKIATAENIATWYSDGYSKYPFFAERASTIRGRFTNLNTKILVAGCGVGYLLQELAALGYTDLWGCDASPYMVARAQAELPIPLNSRVMQASITVRSELAALRTAAGLTGNQKFPLIITEDVLPAMDTDAEVSLALTELRRIGTTVFHIITCSINSPMQDGGTVWIDANGITRSKDFLWKTQAQWKTAVGSEWLLNVETGEVITN